MVEDGENKEWRGRRDGWRAGGGERSEQEVKRGGREGGDIFIFAL